MTPLGNWNRSVCLLLTIIGQLSVLNALLWSVPIILVLTSYGMNSTCISFKRIVRSSLKPSCTKFPIHSIQEGEYTEKQMFLTFLKWCVYYSTRNLCIERLRVTSPIETNTKLTSTWQDQLDQASQYKCVPYWSHSSLFSRISVRMDASPLGSFYCCTSLWRNAKWALQSKRSR